MDVLEALNESHTRALTAIDCFRNIVHLISFPRENATQMMLAEHTDSLLTRSITETAAKIRAQENPEWIVLPDAAELLTNAIDGIVYCGKFSGPSAHHITYNFVAAIDCFGKLSPSEMIGMIDSALRMNMIPRIDLDELTALCEVEYAKARKLAETERVEVAQRMTELLTKGDIARLFGIHRNTVDEILGTYQHQEIAGKYRMRVSDMPPAYFQK